MPAFLNIQARLPRAAGLELSARLSAAHPAWDMEVEDDGLSFALPIEGDSPDAALAEVTEAVAALEKTRPGLTVELETKEMEAGELSELPDRPTPVAAGPWRLRLLGSGESPPPPRPDQLLLPPGSRASKKFWAGESLVLTLLAEHFTPPPGAPETRGLPVLALEAVLPLIPTAAVSAGASSATLAAEDEASGATALALAALAGRAGAVEALELPKRQREDWLGRFGLIAVHLSPYLAARRLKTLRRWLRPGGALIVGGFAPGPQTAHLLRAAARAGLGLSGSIIEGDWAAMKLEIQPEREALPPLTGSVVPELAELPPEELSPEAEELPDEDSLMLVDEDEPEDDGE